MFVDLNLIKSLKRNKMAEVIHKGKTTTWMTNIVIPIWQELNPTIKGRKATWCGWLSWTKWVLKNEENSERCCPALVCTVCKVPQVIPGPYDPSSVEYKAKPVVNVILQNRVKQEGVLRNASHAENNIPNVPVVPEAPLYQCPKFSDSLNRKPHLPPPKMLSK